MLNGNYYFRQVIYPLSSAGNGSLSEAYALYGIISFSGTGTYSMNATLLDVAARQIQTGTLTGTYTIAASGQGFLSSPLYKGDFVFGLVSSQGVFVGSTTENITGYHDIFIAAPIASPLPNASNFRGSYSMAYLDMSGLGSGSPLYTVGAMATLNPDGAGNVGTVPLTAYVGQNGSSKTTQSLSNVKYIFSNGAAKVTFPNSNTALLTGDYYLYFSPDGNFFFGGAPGAADMLVGVRNPSSQPTLSGVYFEAGLDEDESTLSAGYATPDSFYGSLSATGGVILGHQRLLSFFNSSAINYTYSDSATIPANGTYTNGATNYVVGAGSVRIASGIGPYLSLAVALPAPSLDPSKVSSSGVYLDPRGVVNAGSSAPFTAGIAPGELLTLYGSNLSSALKITGDVPFPTTLNNTQVKINGTPAPLYYVSPGQLSAIVPYSVTNGTAQVQVINNGTASNTVTIQVAATAPGILTQSQNGLGFGDAVHQDGSLVNDKNPAQPGETVSLFLTGLGAVNPAISDGAPGPVDTLAKATNNISVTIGGKDATVTYAGLAPQLAGLYQINVTIPTGLTAGNNNLDVAGPDAYTSECVIAVAGSGSTASPALRKAPTRNKTICRR
jgi:uncharacterized protein (TIGR03437 family)